VHRKVVGALEPDLDARLLGLRLNHRQHVLEQRMQIDGRELQILEARKAQEPCATSSSLRT
jgi:hypothetical protein